MLSSRGDNAPAALAHYLRQLVRLFALFFLCHGRLIADESPEHEASSNLQSVRQCIERYLADVGTIEHRYRVPLDEEAFSQRQTVLRQWLDRLGEFDFANLDRDSQIDFLLLRSELEYQLEHQRLEHQRDQGARSWLPYSEGIVQFCKDRENVVPVDASRVASAIDNLAQQVESETAAIDSRENEEDCAYNAEQRVQALRAGDWIDRMRWAVREADGFYRGYDPQYSWWVKTPMQRLIEGLDAHEKILREKVVGVPQSDDETIIGQPIGTDGLALELRHEWVAHSPQELVELAEHEMQWCEQAMQEASQELGFGDDWRAALEHVKSQHVPPGDQPEMIRQLAWEAIRFLQSHDLVTVPPLAANGWRMTMMSPERQRVSPYFLGGETIIVSYPTDEMTHEEKLMSMRSNNEHFARATVHHELIPGHHLQYFMLARYRPYRRPFSTPFWMEGWALYWEMLLWDLDFARNAEDRIGMLFWRMHRCARIIFSLSYHLGTMTPEECIDYLVEHVGHERSAAAAEVRRSIMGGYSPLYQAAYMLGGLQLRRLHEERVTSGGMNNRQFHDAVLQQHSIPIELLRAYLTDAPLSRDMRPSWKFASAE
jgi:uncharacterized protein (DUF885 family)